MDATAAQEPEPERPFRLLDLPDELILAVLEAMEAGALLLTLRTNKQLKEMIDTSHSLKRILFLVSTSATQPVEEWQKDLSTLPEPRYISLSALTPDERAFFDYINRAYYTGSDYNADHPIKTPVVPNPFLGNDEDSMEDVYSLYFPEELDPRDSGLLHPQASIWRMQVCQPAVDLSCTVQYKACGQGPSCDVEGNMGCSWCDPFDGPEGIELYGSDNPTLDNVWREMTLESTGGEIDWKYSTIFVPGVVFETEGVRKQVELDTATVKADYAKYLAGLVEGEGDMEIE